MKYISLFAGIGGFDLALNRQGHEAVYVNEWDKYAAQIYEKNFKHKPDTRDIKQVYADEIPDHDILVGGFPCQSFSVAGKRRGFADTRGTLFYDICRILAAKRPTYLLLENVKGLLSHDNGKTLETIMRSLDELGYDLQWQVLNSKNHGVPQNRERIFIVGHLRGTARPKIFPIAKNDGVYQKGFVSTTLRAHQGGSNQNDTFIEEEVAPTIRATEYKHGDNQTIVAQRVPLKFLSRNQRNIEGDYSFTVDSMNTGGVMISKTVRSGGRKSPHGSKQNWDSYDFDGVIRRLTPIECERLQGFPDNWTEGISDTQRYKCLGNAVTVNVVEFIMRRLNGNIDNS